MRTDGCALFRNHDAGRLRWGGIYREAKLYKAAMRLYTKPLFNSRKALGCSTDEKNLFDFARRGLKNLHALHCSLTQRRFRFREALALKHNFNGKQRVLYVQPWEERLVSLLVYRLLNRALDRHFSSSSYAYRWRGFGVDRCQREIIRTLREERGRESLAGTAPHTEDSRAVLFVMKRDIADFFASIDHAVLLGKLEQFVEPNDYLFELLGDCVRFRFREETTLATAQRGVPFGTAIACLFANVYLMDLDRQLEEIPEIRFFRYADDLLVLSPVRAGIEQAREAFTRELAALGLASKATHEYDFILSDRPCSEGAYPAQRQFRHLGLEFRADGSVGLSRDKARKIRNLFRFAFRKHRTRFRRIKSAEKRAALAAEIAHNTLSRGVRHVAIIDYYLRHVTDESKLRDLDRWLAEEVLSLAFQSGHKKGHFRLLPFRRLRQLGLPCLVHRRRLIRHGHVDSPFFVWKEYRTSQGRGGKAARPEANKLPAFSQDPGAVARVTS